MARILLIDDDPNLLDMLAMAFEDAGHDVQTARDGVRGHRKATQGDPQLIVSDVNMPGMDGFTLCRRLREEGYTLPIVLLTARDTEIDEALGLELGADDYVVKPFSSRVLTARVAALLRREQFRSGADEAATGEVIEARALSLDLERLEARYAGERFETTVTEFRLLCALARRPGIVLSREQLLERIRGDDSVVAERLIDTYVRRLRRKIEAIEPSFDEIETVIGAGYRWRDD
jgi:DNA-binding response OmpR family regulator